MLDELIDRYGRGALVSARPRTLDSGRTYRWELEIDGDPAAGISAHERSVPGIPDGRMLLMVYGDDEIELARWSTTTGPWSAYGPAAVTCSLGQLLAGPHET